MALVRDAQDDIKSQASGNYLPRNSRKFKLPEIELKRFGGDVRDWLGFWGQFKKIDADSEIAPEDKYQYLLQATIAKSRAREIIESFPPTAENYCKAVDHLKSRFGREETLVEVYIRDLLKLVLTNTMNRKQKVNLSSLYDKLETQLRALETLGVTSEKYAAMLYPLVESSLPEDILIAWERNRGYNVSVPIEGSGENSGSNRLTSLMNFLRGEVEGEERVKMARTGFGIESDNQRVYFKREKENTNIASAAGLFSHERMKNVEVPICIFCDKRHSSSDCFKAKIIPFEKKRHLAIRNGCCFSCLKRGHLSKSCGGNQRCNICKRRHLTIMCPNEPNSVSEPINFREGKDSETSKDSALSNQTCSRMVLLQTFRVYLRGDRGRHVVRALIDSGSQKSYISSRAAKLMDYKAIGEEKVTHSLFGGVESSPQKHLRYRIYLTSMDEKYKCNFEVLDQKKICGNITSVPDGPWMNELYERGIMLTDTDALGSKVKLEDDSEIHILIGADIAGKLITGTIDSLTCGLVAIETRLGWTLMGKVPNETVSSQSSMSIVSMLVNDSLLADLWRLESIGIADPSESQTKRELQEAAYQHFRQTVTRDEDGRYEVSLPWTSETPPVSNNLRLAEKRLNLTIKKLTDENILKSYQDVFNSWENDKVIEQVTITENKEKERVHYLPHRAVIKEYSTTKIRPVFDASAHERSYPSLNNCLEKGPNLLELVPSVLTRFRLKRIGVVSDIRQAFLQISVCEADRDFLRFLWYENGEAAQDKIYRHRRVVFGLSCSPFLLGATLSYHLENVTEPLKETAMILNDSFYVDNCVTSLDSESLVAKFIFESKIIMSAGKFDLRGWAYNRDFEEQRVEPTVLISDENSTNHTSSPETKDQSAIVPVLGLYWDLGKDVIFCKVNKIDDSKLLPVTKRKVLSLTQQVFDPLGLICPVTLLPKVLLQECWNLKISWDQELPVEISDKFLNWAKQLKMIENIKIPRWMIAEDSQVDSWTLHVFCDASKSAYAACIFVRVEIDDNITCQLVRAKTRIAPLKIVTIPRLELMACLIGARLADVVKKDMHCASIKTFYWSDSANALHWIKNDEYWATFVNNRVTEIRSLSDAEDWNHVSGTLNPADLPSRGCTPTFLEKSRWWEGPEWLKETQDDWPKSEIFPNKGIVDSEKRKSVISSMNSITDDQYYIRISPFIKIIRVTGWILRFFRNSKTSNSSRITGDLTTDEMKDAEIAILKATQRDSFLKENDEKLRCLQPMVDPCGLIRVKTRLLRREDEENFKYPIILPFNHHIVTELIMWNHIQLCHCGVQVLMTNLREKYWILKSRKTIRKVIRQCVLCRRFTAHYTEVQIAPLPEDRVKDAAVFEVTGVDLAGPLFSRDARKIWIVLFTCAVYRAVHLELVTSLTTENFLQALRRFIARRGRPAVIYSDNGTNFVGTNTAFKKIDWKTVLSETSVRRINWKFIPPAAPWWGGWWERLISMVKQILRRVLGRTSLLYEELNTILCDCESVINSRPLTYVSDDIEDLQALTPSMFLQEIKETGVPDLDQLDNISLPKRYLYRKKLREDLRNRFRAEYLGQLRQNSKRIKETQKISVGEIVLVGSDNSKRIDWPLAKVTEIYPGKDGLVRVVRIKTKSGEHLRPVQRLYPLEIGSQDAEALRRKAITSVENSPHPTEEAEETLHQKNGTNKSSSKDTSMRQQVTTRSGRAVKLPQRLNI